MAEVYYSLIVVVLFLILTISGLLKGDKGDQHQSELHARDRYAIAEQITEHFESKESPASMKVAFTKGEQQSATSC